jgi:hypothetical protein
VSRVVIDGKSYALKTSNELSLSEVEKLRREGPALTELYRKFTQSNSPTDAAAVSKKLDVLCRIVLVAPNAVHRRLGDVNRLRVIEQFTKVGQPVLSREISALGRRAATRRRPTVQ